MYVRATYTEKLIARLTIDQTSQSAREWMPFALQRLSVQRDEARASFFFFPPSPWLASAGRKGSDSAGLKARLC